MKTKQIFHQDGISVWETNNGDVRGKEWHISDSENNGCSVGFKPEFDVVWLKQYLIEYRKEKLEDMRECDDSNIPSE